MLEAPAPALGLGAVVVGVAAASAVMFRGYQKVYSRLRERAIAAKVVFHKDSLFHTPFQPNEGETRGV